MVRRRTCVFVFDSLGSKHPKACAVLSEYLAMEAKDKKGVEQTTKPLSKMALVRSAWFFYDFVLNDISPVFYRSPSSPTTVTAVSMFFISSKPSWMIHRSSRASSW